MPLSQFTDTQPSGPSPQDLAHRRQQLKTQRKIRFYKLAWRTFFMTALAVGTVRLAMSPIWLIRSAAQIDVETSEGARLSEENIRALLPVPYPQSLLNVQPDELASSLSALPPIEEAAVSRRLVPPGLHVEITERQPVAVTIPNIEQPLQEIPNEPVPFEEPGMIDASGYWMPRNSFVELGAMAQPLHNAKGVAKPTHSVSAGVGRIAPPPTLIIKGMQKSQTSSWRSLYKDLSRSPVVITAIDWTRPSNLTLQTELGTVHIGPYGNTFSEQLATLDKMRQLDNQVNPEKVAFIDLKDPQTPVIQILQAASNPLENP